MSWPIGSSTEESEFRFLAFRRISTQARLSSFGVTSARPWQSGANAWLAWLSAETRRVVELKSWCFQKQMNHVLLRFHPQDSLDTSGNSRDIGFHLEAATNVDRTVQIPWAWFDSGSESFLCTTADLLSRECWDKRTSRTPHLIRSHARLGSNMSTFGLCSAGSVFSLSVADSLAPQGTAICRCAG